VHIAPACSGSDHFGSYLRSLSLHLCKRLFPGLKPMTVTRQQLYHCARAPLPMIYRLKRKNKAIDKMQLGILGYLLDDVLLKQKHQGQQLQPQPSYLDPVTLSSASDVPHQFFLYCFLFLFSHNP
jgi:hypothetical protein